MNEPSGYKAWSECSSCGFKGVFPFACRSDERYDDPDSLGVMMDSSCPACGEIEAVLVSTEEYADMVHMARRGRD